MSGLVVIERPEDGVALVRINRPEARNALSFAVREALHDAFAALAEDESVRAIILTGDAQAFAAGADLKEIAELSAVEAMRRRTDQLARPLRECPKPVIAAVQGFCLGGGLEIAMQCDIIVAGEGAQMGLPEIRVGVMPGSGGTQRLTRAVGKPKAMLMVLTGQMVSGKDAAAMGLASLCVPDDKVQEEALGIARRIAALPPIAAQMIKETVLAGADAPLATALMLERRGFNLLFATEDQKEGARAFIGKRKPQFKGR
ncbi:MAG: enoyl-CoA hydratase [Alphaproteobacteria bacterium]|nr:enoyl-CoA hydratase [Alphaproteobacteria bacterium]